MALKVVSWNSNGWGQGKLEELHSAAKYVGGDPHVIVLQEVDLEVPTAALPGYWTTGEMQNLAMAPRGRGVALLLAEGSKVLGQVCDDCWVVAAVATPVGQAVVVGLYIPPV